jgi:CBS domain-containing protein
MSVSVVSVEANDTVIDVANMFLNTERRRFPVLEDNRLVGVISRRDVLRALVDINKR